MSEENLPEDVNLNEESSAEANEELQDAVEEVQEFVTENPDSSQEVNQDDAEESTGEKQEVDSPGEKVETENPVIDTPEPAKVEGTGVMAAAVAAATTVATEESVKEVKPEPTPVKAEPVDDGRRWYSLRVISGKERKIKERIELEIQRNNWGGSVSQVLVPSEKVYKIRSGKKVILERNILPGYILIEAYFKKFSPEIVQGIANIPNVIHFLGKTKPIPMQQSEANRMLGKVDESQEVGEALIEPFIVGETVKIIDGPFNGFVGDIKEVNEEKKKLKVIVKIFGRGTEVELNFMQVEKES